MSGTLEGGRKAAATIKAKYGADFYKKQGSIGGKNGRGHQFAHGKADPSVVGKIGGRVTKKDYKAN